MKDFSISPIEMVASFWRNKSLIISLTQREIIGRYRGSVMGILWSFFNPLLMLAIYTFVFGYIFKSRWSTDNHSTTEFALVLFAGLLIFNLFAECVNKSPSLIINNANYVKKVVFPLEIMAWVSLGSALFHALVSLAVWLIAYFVFFGFPNPTVLLFPLVIIPLILLIMGITWFLSSLGVYLRDSAQFVGILVTAMMFLSPIFYSPTALSENFRWLLMINPLTPIIEEARGLLYWGKMPEWDSLLMSLIIGFVVAYFGFVWFQKTRKGFADVI